MKRVVVTGLGAITPLGNNVSEFWDNLVKGTCGIKEITKFDTTNYKVKLAAEVHQFDPLQYMDKMELRHTDLMHNMLWRQLAKLWKTAAFKIP